MGDRPDRLPPLQNLNVTDLPPELLLLIRDKLLDLNLPVTICAKWNAWCRVSKSAHAMCTNPDDPAWMEGCKLLGLDEKPDMTWRAAFNKLCNELHQLAKQEPAPASKWYLRFLKAKDEAASAGARGAVWLRRCAAEMRYLNGASSLLRRIGEGYGSQEELNEAFRMGRQADHVFQSLAHDGTIQLAPVTLQVLQDAYAQGGDVDVEALGEHGLPVASPLYLAVVNHRVAILEWLISAGANVEFSGTRLKPTPLMTASFGGRTQIVEALIRGGADVDAAATILWFSNAPTNPLMLALYKNHAAVVQTLLDAGADPNFTLLLPEPGGVDGGWVDIGETALMMASKRGNLTIVNALLRAGADVHTVDARGRDAMWRAQRYGRVEIMDSLVAADLAS